MNACRLPLLLAAATLVQVTAAAQLAQGPHRTITVRASLDEAGSEAPGPHRSAAISWDGRFVAFASDSAWLVRDDTNGATDVFVRDLVAGTTERVSVSANGEEGDAFSIQPSISADGRYVAFYSAASNLVAGDTNGATDVFVHDRWTRSTRCVSVSSSGELAAPSFQGSTWPSISADGSRVAFVSAAGNLVADDTNSRSDVFVHDLRRHVTVRCSVSSRGEQGNGNCKPSWISPCGGFVGMRTGSTNLVEGDTNLRRDIFVRDLEAETTTRISTDSFGAQGDGATGQCSLSFGGRFVVFASSSTNLVPGGTAPGDKHVYLHDRELGTTQLVTVAFHGGPSSGQSSYPKLTPDGRYCVFASDAPDLVVDGNDTTDVYVRDLVRGTTRIVSRAPGGLPGDRESLWPVVSADGRFVAYESRASNLVPDDTSGLDVLVGLIATADALAPVPRRRTGSSTEGSPFASGPVPGR